MQGILKMISNAVISLERYPDDDKLYSDMEEVFKSFYSSFREVYSKHGV